MSAGSAAPEAPRSVDDTERRRTGRLLVAVCATAVAMRLLYASQPLRSDEGGYLLLARHWDPGGGEFLYGDYHVDRPPLLLAVYRLAAQSDWDGTIRVLTVPFVVAAVLALARAGFLTAGWRAARWSAVVGGALVCSPALAADQADGELFAVPFVAASVALALEAWRRPAATASLPWAIAAGLMAASASLVKQSFLEGLVFAGVMVLAQAIRQGRAATPPCLAVGVGSTAGALLAYAATYAWLVSNDMDPRQFWTDVVTFRGEALMVIWRGSLDAPLRRAATLVVLAVVSAMVPLAWTWLRRLRNRARRWTALECAVTGMLLYGLWAMVAGGSYWAHYLLQGATALALAAGMVAAGDDRWGQRMRRWAGAAVASAVLACVGLALAYATVPHLWFHERTGQWVRESAAPGDTAFVAYGHPSVLEAANVSSPYPYVWSLPMRTLDPTLQRLRRTLAGAEAPTWVVRMSHLNSWDIDPDGDLRELLEARYRRVEDVCGYAIFLRSDVVRQLAPAPRC